MFSFVVTNAGGDQLRSRVDNAKKRLPDIYEYVDEIANAFVIEVRSSAPRKTNLLVIAASTIERKGGRGSGDYSVGVGPFHALGYPSDSAPRNKIRQFINDNKGNREITGGMPPVPRAAWSYLTRKGQNTLLFGRLAGRYGMYGGKPRYWQAMHEGTVPSITGGVRPRNMFIDYAHSSALARYVSRSTSLGRSL